MFYVLNVVKYFINIAISTCVKKMYIVHNVVLYSVLAEPSVRGKKEYSSVELHPVALLRHSQGATDYVCHCILSPFVLNVIGLTNVDEQTLAETLILRVYDGRLRCHFSG